MHSSEGADIAALLFEQAITSIGLCRKGEAAQRT